MPMIIKSVDCPKESLKKDDVLFKEGSSESCFYIVKKGGVSIFKNHGTPHEICLGSIEAGQVLGEISAIDGLPRSATAVANVDATVVKVSAETLRHQLRQCPGWLEAIVQDLVARLRKTDELLTKHGIVNSQALSSSEKHEAAHKD